jgi:hypothetical protein
MEEEKGVEEVTSFEKIKDHSDPLMVNQDPNLSNLAINSPKHFSESDDDVMNENFKAQAKASMATKSTSGSSIMVMKSTTGSTTSHQAETLAKKTCLKNC